MPTSGVSLLTLFGALIVVIGLVAAVCFWKGK